MKKAIEFFFRLEGVYHNKLIQEDDTIKPLLMASAVLQVFHAVVSSIYYHSLAEI